MKKTFSTLLIVLLSLLPTILFAQEEEDELYNERDNYDFITLNDSLEMIELTNNCYLYTSWCQRDNGERVGYNGLVIVNGSYVTMVNTPSSKEQTIELSRWFKKNHNARVGFCLITSHDPHRVAGIEYLNKHKTDVMASAATNAILEQQGLVKALGQFKNSFTVKGENDNDVQILRGMDNKSIDQCVVWLPAQKLLFGGDLIESIKSNTLNPNIAATSYNEWLSNLDKLKKQLREINIVVPGYGFPGEADLLEHTMTLLRSKK